MKLGFVILSHRTPSRNFIKLLDFLHSIEGARIALHHDFSQSEFPQDIAEKYNIELVRPHHTTKWGHISKVPATLDTFFKLYDDNAPDWFITVSPNCYPIKDKEAIVNFFKNATHDTYIESAEISPEKGGIFTWHHKTIFTKYIMSLFS